MLPAIWAASIGTALVAVLAMAVLVGIRLATERRAQARARRRDDLLVAILAWLDGGVPDENAQGLLASDRALSADLLIEMFEIVRGEDQARLADLSDRAGIPAHLYGVLARGSTGQRLVAADTLVWFPSETTRAALRRALDDPDDEVGLTVAGSLVDLGEDQVLQRLVVTREARLASTSRRLEAVLARVATRHPGDLVWLAADDEAPDRVRAAALDAVTQTGAFDLLDEIAALARSPSTEVRAAVARSLGVFGHPQGEAAVTELLGDPNREVRAEAAEAAGRIGLIGLVDRLCALLDDECWWVRFRAGHALMALGESGIEALRGLARIGGGTRRSMAGAILAERRAA